MPIPLLAAALRTVATSTARTAGTTSLRTAARAAKKAGVSKAGRRQLAKAGKLTSYLPQGQKKPSRLRKAAGAMFSKTPAGKLLGTVGEAVTGGGKGGASDGEAIQRGGSSGLSISKQTLEVLHNIDDDLKDVLTALSSQKQKDAAAEEEAKDEAAKAVGPEGEDIAQPQESGMMAKIGKLLMSLSLFGATLLMPLVDLIKSAFKSLLDLGKTLYDMFNESVLPIFTETLPKLFMEDIPMFFKETLPKMFKDGIENLREKFTNILSGIGDIMGNIKSTVGELILSLADSSVAKFLLPDSVITSIKKLGTDLMSSKPDALMKEAAKGEGKKPGQVATAVSPPAPVPPKARTPAIDSVESVNAKIAEQQKNLKEYSAQSAIADRSGDTRESDRLQIQIKLANKNIDELKKVKSKLENVNEEPVKKETPGPGGTTATSMPSGGGATPSAGGGGSSGGGYSGGGAATPVSSGGSGAAVSDASMAASAPETTNPRPTSTPAGSNKIVKTQSDPGNPVGNVPEVAPNLGSIANLWYHNASA